jgi:hypothetical protein
VSPDYIRSAPENDLAADDGLVDDCLPERAIGRRAERSVQDGEIGELAGGDAATKSLLEGGKGGLAGKA